MPVATESGWPCTDSFDALIVDTDDSIHLVTRNIHGNIRRPSQTSAPTPELATRLVFQSLVTERRYVLKCCEQYSETPRCGSGCGLRLDGSTPSGTRPQCACGGRYVIP